MNNTLRNYQYVHFWLIICCCMVFVMVIIGGLTRLTDSGLSIVEWKILSGILPPLSNTDWIMLFEKYKEYPEYQLINLNISLQEFKFIFWMEYLHRIWGRLIFLVFFVPLVIFFKKNFIPHKFQKDFFFIILLILIQGFFGWYMVKSGLVNKPDVSHYKLSIHLIIAFFIYGYLLYLTFSFDELKKNKKKLIVKNNSFIFLNLFLVILILITVFSGGMVAGLDAGLIYNTFPLMGESFIPNEILELNPKFLNFFENPVTVQFDHRLLGIATCILVLAIWVYSRNVKIPKDIKKKINILTLAVIIQICLGIATILSYVAIPVAIIHQAGALILYTISIWTLKSLPFVSK